MKINAMQIDGFGAWSHLKVEGLSEGINVFYGPNEAGKTTLLQFVRSMLYGVSAERQRYLPPVHGGQPGGWVDIAGPNGRFQVSRHQETTPEGVVGEQLTLTAPDGMRQGEHFLRVLLCNVDEAIFNNVFAVGLGEMQELGTLSDTEAAELLYNLTAGLDRISLVEVMRELENSRNRILDANGKTCLVTQWLAEREKLRSEIEELAALSRRFGHLVIERNEIDGDVARWQEEINRIERQAVVVELALVLRERWGRRAALEQQIASLGSLKPMPENAVERLDQIQERLKTRQQKIEELATQREALKEEYAELTINESLWRQAARIEAFKEQGPWIAQLQSQISEIEAEIAGVEFQLGEECERLGLGSKGAALPTFSSKKLAALRSPAKAMRQCRQQREEASQAATSASENAASLHQQIESALTARNERDLPGALDRAGNAVLQLRRRVQIDERLDQLARYQNEMEERNRKLTNRQVLPAWVLMGIGAVFVLGVMLLLTGLFMPTSVTGSLGLTLALLGLAGSGVAGGAYVVLNRANTQQLDASQKQLGVLQLQVQQTREDRDHLDAQLPRGNGSASSRLQAAERELAELEELTPLETRRNAARQDAETAAKRLAAVEEEVKAAGRRWRQSVAAAGLPENLTIKQVRRFMQRAERIGEMQRRLKQRKEELGRRKQEIDSVASKIAQLAADGGVSLSGTNPIEHLQQLSEAIGRQEAAFARREAVRREARKIREAQVKQEEGVSRLKHRRHALLLEAGVEDEREFRNLAARYAEVESLYHDRNALTREIQAALASHCSEDGIRQQLEDVSVPLETRREGLQQRLDSLRQQLHGRLEKRGQLAEQINTLAADRQLANKHLELAMLEKRLHDAVQRWQVLAVTCRVLELIRTTYEQQRQPETLCEASGYLERMTRGRYCRVWTPLGESVLRVDDSDGHSLPVEVLSRGTREQLFLCLRLALTSCYARRGAALPLVLDDVLVNFDSERAKSAAAVLCDFAAQGHQLLVFTCHEHVLQMFKALKAPASQLPDNTEGRPHVLRFERSEDVKEPPVRESREPMARKKRAEKPKKAHREETPPQKASTPTPAIEPDTEPDLPSDVKSDAEPDFVESVVDEVEPIVKPKVKSTAKSVSEPVEKKADRKPRAARAKKRSDHVFDVDFFDADNNEDEEVEAWEEESEDASEKFDDEKTVEDEVVEDDAVEDEEDVDFEDLDSETDSDSDWVEDDEDEEVDEEEANGFEEDSDGSDDPDDEDAEAA
jgi:uncharacterized protein YhaN